MLELIEAPQAEAKSHSRYKLPDSDRKAILALTPSAIQAAEVERQRNAFIEMYGSPFGDED